MSPDPPATHARSELEAFIVSQGLGGGTIASLLQGCAERLLARGVPLSRAYIALPTISPDTRAMSVTWRRDGLTRDGVEHERYPGAFDASPVAFMLRNGIATRRWRLSSPDGCEGYDLLQELRAQGDADYLVHLVAFGGAEAPTALRGVALSVCTDAPAGFRDEDVVLLERLAPLLALAAYRIALLDVTVDVLGAYVGRDAGRRVLSGEMRRGQGHVMPAALMIADLRGFTSVAETRGEGLIARLGEHLAAMAEPVEESGGEVLKFLGDGLLAAFPVDATAGSGQACAAALEAARRALARNAAVNARGGAQSRLPLDVALHLGDVFYGNVGAGRRLDFTVIGPAVNEVARIEALCGALDRPLLMSAPFAAQCGGEAVSLGRHRLRGVAEEREIFAPADL